MTKAKRRKLKKQGIRISRNADAERFLRITKTRRKQEREFEAMNQSFYADDLLADFDRALAYDRG